MIGDILQPTHLLFVLVVALLVLGPKRLPEVGRSLGRGLRDFRQAVSGEEIRDVLTGTTELHREPADDAEPSQPTEALGNAPTEASPVVDEPAPVEPEAENSESVKQNVA